MPEGVVKSIRSDNRLLQAALGYAELGYRVFPCVPGTKKPLTEHGFHDATTDSSRIEAWWAQWPTANVAISTQGMVVIDADAVDGRPNPWLENEPEKQLALSAAPMSLTPRGGSHHIFKRPSGKSWRCSTGRLAPHVDVRADGGYIVLPPSVTGDGTYRWQETMALDCPPEALPVPPAWLAEMLDGLSSGEQSQSVGDGNDVPAGQRNATLARLAGTMRRVGMTEAEILAALLQVNRDRCRPPLDAFEVNRIAASIARYEPDQVSVAFVEDHFAQDFQGNATSAGPGPVTVVLSDVEPEPVRWLWPGRIPLGKLTLLCGDPGLGKSFITLDLAARVSSGRFWPDLPLVPNPSGGVVLLSAEDDLADTIRPRLDAAGADPSRVVAIQAVRRTKGGREEYFSLDEDLPALETAVRQTADCRLVVIDPLTAYLDKTDSHKNAEMRGVLAKLFDLAARRGVAVLAVTHLNKANTLPAIYRAMGSLAFVAAARAVWTVARDGNDETGRRRLFVPVKVNLGRDETGLAYALEQAGDTARVAWEPEPVNIRADEALSGGRTAAAQEDARRFVVETLEANGGDMASDELAAAAEAQGISEPTFRRARKAVAEAYKEKGRDGRWRWKLKVAQETH